MKRKLTQSVLKRMIKEEKAKLLKETGKQRIDSADGMGFAILQHRGDGISEALDVTIEFQEAFRPGTLDRNFNRELKTTLDKMGQIFDEFVAKIDR